MSSAFTLMACSQEGRRGERGEGGREKRRGKGRGEREGEGENSSEGERSETKCTSYHEMSSRPNYSCNLCMHNHSQTELHTQNKDIMCHDGSVAMALLPW